MTNNDKNTLKKYKFTTIVSETKEIPQPVINHKNEGFLTWGTDNKYPQYLYTLYTNSSQMSSIIKTMIDYITGDEIVNNSRLQDAVNRKGETMNDLIEKLVLDYCIYGGFALQVVRNHNGDVAELNNIDFRTVRTNEDEDTIYVNSSWKSDVAKRGVQTKVYDRYVKGAKQPNSIFYYKGHLTYEVYPTPMYIGAVTSLEISTQIANYHLRNITNNFTPSAIVNFNNGDNLPDEVVEEIENNIYDKFTGTNNAGSIVLSFNADKEHSTTLERLQDDGLDNKYQNLATSVKEDIYSAFRINEVLVGLNKQTGFSKTEFSEAFELYNKTVIKPIQQDIVRAMNDILGENSIEIKQFTIDWGDDREGSVESNSDNIEQ